MPSVTPSDPPEPPEPGRTVVLDLPGRLDPRCLERAVREIVARRPELAARRPGATAPSLAFTHLEMAAVRPRERPGVMAAWRWGVGRCLARDRGASLFVAYLDPGADSQGHLLVAGRGSEESCATLADLLLRQCGKAPRSPSQSLRESSPTPGGLHDVDPQARS